MSSWPGRLTTTDVTYLLREQGFRSDSDPPRGIAMGAKSQDMVHLILSRAALLIALGTGLGALGAFGFTRFLGSLLTS